MTAKQCQAITQDGTPCRAYATNGSDYCFHHDPDYAARRREARRNGGLARHGRHIGPTGQAEPAPLDTAADVATLLRRTINDTLQLENSLHRARTVGYLAGLLARAMELTNLEQQLASMERILELRRNSR